MLMSLEKEDIQYELEERDHIKYGPEPLTVLIKNFDLIDMYGRNKSVDVYIKIKMKNKVLPIISFHINE